MERKIVSGIMLTLLFIGMLTLSYPPTFGDGYNPAAHIQDPNSQIYLDQLWYNFTSPPSKVGTKFYVDVYSYNISNLYAFQVVLDYNSTLLNCTNAWPNKGWDDPDWVFNKYGAGAWGLTGWNHYGDKPTSGRSAELVGDIHFEIANISLTDTEALMARFEFEILLDPEENEELSCVLGVTSDWLKGTFVQSIEETSTYQRRSPWLTDSYCNIKWVLLSDLNDDGIVNILDLVVVNAAFGSFPEHPRWNPIADLDNNGFINIIDLATVAAEFGKTV